MNAPKKATSADGPDVSIQPSISIPLKRSKALTLTIIAVCSVLLGGVMGAAVITRVFFVDYLRIPQDGMYPGLPAGSIFCVAKRPYSEASQVKRGDIILFIRDENGQRYNDVWRVIGLPGETIEISGESLAIDGQPVKRERVREADGKTIYREQIGDASYEIAVDHRPATQPPNVSLTVPADQFFVMGDNRFRAVDSRYFGPVAFGSIIGKKL